MEPSPKPTKTLTSGIYLNLNHMVVLIVSLWYLPQLQAIGLSGSSEALSGDGSAGAPALVRAARLTACFLFVPMWFP